MNYWDSSGLVPLFVDQSTSDARRELLRGDAGIVTWWGSAIECASALNRLRRERLVDDATLSDLLARLVRFESHWDLIPPVEQVKRIATRNLRIHSLRAADSLQLAAALVAADGNPENLGFVTNDDRLAQAARLEGFALR